MSESRPSKKEYYLVSAALMVLLAATVGVSFLKLGAFSIVVALSIAFAKMALIALYFMHVKFSSKLTMLFAAAGLYWLLIMFVLTFGDYVTR